MLIGQLKEFRLQAGNATRFLYRETKRVWSAQEK